MIRTGIYGGSFNPIHNGHIAIAQAMLRQGALDEVWLMVSPQNPLKQAADLLDDQLRLDMVRRAVARLPHIEACDHEFHMPRPSYMWNTLQSLSHDYADRQFALLIGADNWAVFDRWYHAKDIIANYPIDIYPREGYPIDTGRLPRTATLVDTGLHNVSSTQVRRLVRDGGDPSPLVPEEIADDVRRLYGPAVTSTATP